MIRNIFIDALCDINWPLVISVSKVVCFVAAVVFVISAFVMIYENATHKSIKIIVNKSDHAYYTVSDTYDAACTISVVSALCILIFGAIGFFA